MAFFGIEWRRLVRGDLEAVVAEGDRAIARGTFVTCKLAVTARRTA